MVVTISHNDISVETDRCRDRLHFQNLLEFVRRNKMNININLLLFAAVVEAVVAAASAELSREKKLMWLWLARPVQI